MQINDLVDGDLTQLNIDGEVNKGAAKGGWIAAGFAGNLGHNLPADLLIVMGAHGDLLHRAQHFFRHLLQHHLAVDHI
ncbi:hypothetical protein D3C78_1494340 [compost metagenome]